MPKTMTRTMTTCKVTVEGYNKAEKKAEQITKTLFFKPECEDEALDEFHTANFRPYRVVEAWAITEKREMPEEEFYRRSKPVKTKEGEEAPKPEEVKFE